MFKECACLKNTVKRTCLSCRYCNSHLQVMGILPKKERKKKQDTIESLALNITVPSLALKTHNGLELLPPSPPPSLACLLPSDPFAFCTGDIFLKSSGTFLKKPQESQSLNHKQKQQDHSVDPAFPNHLRASSLLSSTLPRPCLPPPQTGRTTQTPKVPSSPHTEISQSPAVRSGSLFKTSSTLQDSLQGSIEAAPADNKIKLDFNHAFDKRVVPAASGTAPSRDDIHRCLLKMHSVAKQQQAPCLQQFNRLVDQHRRRYQDLNPHLGR